MQDREIFVRAFFRVMAAAILMAGAARADEAEDFFRGRTVNLVVGHEVGTGFDVYTRLLAKHYGRFIPGKPAVAVQNMQGASGMTAANWLYNIAPKDGTVIATYTHSVVFEPLTGDNTARFDPLKFSWIGNMDESTQTCVISPTGGVATFDDLFAKEALFGGSGAGTAGPLSQTPNAIRNLTGAKIKLIQGYRGSFDIKLAIERNEVHGLCGLPTSTARTEWRDMLDSGRIRFLLQLGRKKHPDLAGVTHIYDYAKSDEDRYVYDLIFGTQGLGRPYMAPPGVPAPRVEALRKALLDTMADADFLADAKTAQVDITPLGGEAVRKLLADVFATPAAAVERAKKAVRVN
jgi:tripartite-type tricarboxylate transporter receptor subunit TctC